MSCPNAAMIETSRLSPISQLYQECVYMDVSLVHHTALVHPSSKIARRAPTPPVPPQSMSHRSPSPKPSSRLPDEIFAQIAQYVLGDAFYGLDVAQLGHKACKPPFGDIDGMTRASRRLRAISLPEWFRLFIVGHVNDWVWASRLSGMHTWVRHVVCSASALECPAPVDVLSRFPYLRSAALSPSSDYEFNPTVLSHHEGNVYPGAPVTQDRQLGFNYIQPVSTFPSTMTSLSVRATHGSETPLLRNLGLQCPDLRKLRLGKCTMFDSCTGASGARCDSMSRRGSTYSQIADGSECAYWATFPFDHEMYFGSEGIESYADELAAELAPLQNLEEVSVGVYLTPNAALAEHRLAHYPLRHLQDAHDAPTADHHIPTASQPHSLQPPILLPQSITQPPYLSFAAPTPSASSIPTPQPPVTTFTPWSTSQVLPPPYMDSSLWSYDCQACRKTYSAQTAVAEHTAGLVLAASLPKLNKIEWASFFETRTYDHGEFRRGTGTHEWHVLRDDRGAVLDVERVY